MGGPTSCVETGGWHALSSDHSERVIGVLPLEVLPQVAQVVEAGEVNCRTRGRLASGVLLVRKRSPAGRS